MSDPTAVTQMKESIVMSETALQATDVNWLSPRMRCKEHGEHDIALQIHHGAGKIGHICALCILDFFGPMEEIKE